MPNCPKCKSKHIIPIVYGECSDIIRRGAAEGKYLLKEQEDAKPRCPILHCKDCGFDWSPLLLSAEYIKKLRWKRVDYDTMLLGTKIVELFPDGRLRYYEYLGNSKKATYTDHAQIPAEVVEKIFQWANESCFYDCGENVPVNADYFRLQVPYADGYKNTFCDCDKIQVSSWMIEALLDEDDILYHFFLVPTVEEARKANEKLEAEQAAKEAQKTGTEARNKNQKEEKPDRRVFFLKSRKADARAIWTQDGFLVLAGSKLASTETRSCRRQVHDRRLAAIEQGEVKDWILQKNKLFKGASPACEFISGGLGDGNLWKNYRGTSAKADPAMDENDEEMEKLEEEMTEAEKSVTDVILSEELIDTYPIGFFNQSLEALNEHFGAHDEMVITERVRRYCQLMLDYRDYLDGLVAACFEAENQEERQNS